jgi:hypothetical protein
MVTYLAAILKTCVQISALAHVQACGDGLDSQALLVGQGTTAIGLVIAATIHEAVLAWVDEGTSDRQRGGVGLI